MLEKYQKIQIHSTTNLAKDLMLVNEEKKVVQSLMFENKIDYIIEVNDEDLGRKEKYTLDLIIKKADVSKVIEILDNFGGLGYEIDFDETITMDTAVREEIEKENFERNKVFDETTNLQNNKLDETELDINFAQEESTTEPIQEFPDFSAEDKLKKAIIRVILYIFIMFGFVGYILFF